MPPGRVKSVLLSSLLVLVCAGCASRGAPPEQKVQIVTDRFSKYISIMGISATGYPGITTDAVWGLQSLVDPKTAAVQHFIITDLTYDGNSRGSYTASDDTARVLKVTVLFKDSCAFNRCARTDSLSISIDEATLRSRINTGLEVKVFPRSGDWIILRISPQMINEQFAALAGVMNSLSPAVASTPPADPPAANANLPSPAPAPKRPAPNRVGLMMIPQSTSEMTHGAIRGAAVMSVMPNSPADIAGVKGGDLIVRFDGHDVDSGKEVQDLIEKIKPTGAVKLDILRGPTHITANVKLP